MESLVGIKTQSWLSWFLRGILILGFLVLIARLVELQIIKGGYFRSLAEGNRIKRIPIPASRGQILARGGDVIVGNKQTKKKIEDETITDFKRDYKFGPTLSHVTGYLGEVSVSEVGKVDPSCPQKGPKKAGDLVGRSGLEEEYNCELSGADGEELIEVDTKGRKIRTLGRKNPVPGEDLKTTIDINLQQKAAQVLGEKKGTVIIVDTKGEILALYSSPSFDPNVFVGQDDRKISSLLKDSNLPLFNRAIGGMFHPGSVFKPIVASAALAEGKIDKNFLFDDPGVITVNKFTYSNWYFNQYGRKEGTIDLVRAIARSTDTFFYKVGEMVGPDKLAYWANAFGMGRPSGIDIPGEISGLVPTPAWKLKTKGEPWFLGNTYHMSIGQGDIAITPIQESAAISAIASGGILCKPHIINGEPSCSPVDIKSQNLDLVKKGMVAACSSGGTGYTFFDFKIPVGCKTGTAETSIEGEPHAWFVVFAPSESPEIVVTVLIEKGGEGSKVAGPIAREILDYWAGARQ